MNNIDALVKTQKLYFNTHKNSSYQSRINNLIILKNILIENEDLLVDALYKDLHKGAKESYLTEIGFVLNDIDDMIKHLKGFMKPKKVKTNLLNIPGKSYIMTSPYGVALVISPWNYPVNLALSPLVGAIASGNTVILKPSEISIHTSKALEEIINPKFDEGLIHVVLGEVAVTTELLKADIDYVFFTGSPNVGRIVARACVERFVPYTLELGGKSPCIVDDYDLKIAAKRIIYGKLLNGGQTCVAPDYVIVKEDLKDELVKELLSSYNSLYENRLSCEYYPKIISTKHYERLLSLLEGVDTINTLETNDNNQIGLTLVDNPKLSNRVMTEEIFGPILPILTYKDLSEVEEIVSKNPNPLAFYLFSKDEKVIKRLTSNIMFGGCTINDTIMHLSNPNLPFGGVRTSGTGSYHGRKSYLTFSHEKSVIKHYKLEFKFRYLDHDNDMKFIRRIYK